MSVEQAQDQMSEPAGNSQHGRSAFAAQGRGKEAASVAFYVSGILVALPNTANYVLFASYMMHATYCIAYYVHCSVAGPTKTQRAQSSSKVLVPLSIDCQMHGNIACGSHRNACGGTRSHTTCRRLVHTGVCVTILPWRFRVTLLRVSRFKYGSESECTNSWLYCLNVSCELS